MRKIRNNVMLIIALLPLLAYLFAVFRSGTVPNFLEVCQSSFGDFGAFFLPLLTPLFTSFVPLTDVAGVALLSWIIGYYIALLFTYIVFTLFTCLITLVMDKIDKLRGQ